MKVRDVMTTAVVTVGPEATFAEVVDTLLDNDVGGVPVVDGAGRLLGVVTEADLVAKEAYGDRPRRALGLVVDYLRGHDPQWVRKAAGRTARELMTMAPVTVAPGDDLAVAAQFMLEFRHARLPVVEDGRLVGIVARQDLLEALRASGEGGGRGGDGTGEGEARATGGDPVEGPDPAPGPPG
ncbi:MAG TPA: CBS domain-containing protein [Acidimicrobiales bacterium]|nr:CBS domain-containing protein [Acidimicrobiales bacterium]